MTVKIEMPRNKYMATVNPMTHIPEIRFDPDILATGVKIEYDKCQIFYQPPYFVFDTEVDAIEFKLKYL